ncbi:unnamed protein product [Parascedosporium putredinis]|uniref:Uncharacterized protein n=1 Tax=Parascedosporium putredinis TaxID=1442378 RepID=A0A9P1H4A9_9PEZI|nr:unnamed protein product [Parascedosporium putredinis]CAI7998079.1 unnamed protein product [Parascedosporium putredinis]
MCKLRISRWRRTHDHDDRARRPGRLLPDPRARRDDGHGTARDSRATPTASRRSSSPPRPPVSPITPTLAPARLATAPTATKLPGAPPAGSAATTNSSSGGGGGGSSAGARTASEIMASLPPRQTFAHAQPNQVGVPLPPPKPISFDENPDTLALQSAIAVLQMQRRRAEEDIRTLSRAKNDALRDTEGFVKDLISGRVSTTGALGPGPIGDDDDDDDEDSDENDTKADKGPTWRKLPGRQDVVRCPPINWAKYAVVGESLDKLHADQKANPIQGAPATFAPDGTYEFKGDGEKTQFIGVAAPYTPGRDKLVGKKPKVPRR